MRRVVPLLALSLVLPAAAMPQARALDTRALDAQIEKLRGELVQLGASEQAGEGMAIDQREKLLALNAQEAALKARIDANRGDLAKLLSALQAYQRRPPPPLLVNPRSAKDAVRAAILIRAITPELEARGRAFAVQAEALAKVRRSAAAASESLFQAESDIADRRAEIDRLTAAKLGLEDRAFPSTGRPDAATQALAASTGSVGDFVQALPPRAPASAAPPATAPDHLGLPVQGVVVRRFGQAGKDGGRAEGWTWRAASQAAVIAPAPARVDYAGPLKGWGQVVILNAGGSLRLVLAGLETVSVGSGRNVAAGEPIGHLGPAADGGKTPPELYLEVRGQGGAVDPARWVRLASGNSAAKMGANSVRR